MTARPLPRTSTAEALADALAGRILTGALAPGAHLREVELAREYDVARHTLRAAFALLAARRLVRIAPHRGAWVSELTAAEVRGLFELRAALEGEAVRLWRERTPSGRWTTDVRAAATRLDLACAPDRPDSPATRLEVDAAHAALHAAIVAAGGSARIAQAHRALEDETRIFLLQLRPHWSPALMRRQHRALLRDVRRDGPDAVRRHLLEAAEHVHPGPPMTQGSQGSVVHASGST